MKVCFVFIIGMVNGATKVVSINRYTFWFPFRGPLIHIWGLFYCEYVNQSMAEFLISSSL